MSIKINADALLRMAAETGDVPGVVAMATDRNGTIYEGGFGTRVLGEAVEMTPDTVVWIASMTKALTGTAAMQLVNLLSMRPPAMLLQIFPFADHKSLLLFFAFEKSVYQG